MMGLFDTVVCSVKCPYCGGLLSEWQTKDFKRTMSYYNLGDNVENVYDGGTIRVLEYCDNCEKAIYGKLIIIDGYICGIKIIRE